MDQQNSIKRQYALFVKTAFLYAAFFIYILLPIPSNAQPSNTEINLLDTRFRVLSTDIYRHHASQPENDSLINNDIDSFATKTRQLFANKEWLTTNSYIKTNLEILKANLHNKIIFETLEWLLQHNEYVTANALYQEIQHTEEPYLIENANFIFAKYHVGKHEWQKVHDLISDNLENLASEDIYSHAYILKGMALQYLKQHRDAIKYYQKIPDTSRYYAFAQLNIATAYIRQDWWTDAHNIIKQLLNNDKNKNDKLTNHLYLVLGYSSLNKGYYRESREAFRNITLDSQYINKALMGISLAAASQKDYIAALNALTRLKKNQVYDLVTEEIHILLPVIYEKLKQHIAAKTRYLESITYYQKRINQLNTIIEKPTNQPLNNITIKNGVIFIEDTALIFTEQYPQSFLDNLAKLQHIESYIHEPHLKQQTKLLHKEYKQLFRRLINTLLKNRIKLLDSYLNQSRYGLAQLYDKNRES